MFKFFPMMSSLTALRKRAAKKRASEVIFAWEREAGCAYRFVLPIPEGQETDAATIRLVERVVKTVLWASGGWRLYLAGPKPICDAIETDYSAGGARDFDRDMMLKAYGKPVEIIRCQPEEVPETRDAGKGAGVSMKGCRLGFDLGASDFKIAAVEDGEVRFNDEFPWDPRNATDPAYHFDKLNEGLKSAAATLPRVDAIGGSSAGIVVANEMRVASLFRAIPMDRYAEAQQLFKKVERKWQVPVQVQNDGDVTALAAYLTSGQKAVLGIAMGSSEAGGYLDREGSITGRLNELAFAPVDFSETAPTDEWSGDRGVGAMYFSQQATNFLAGELGITFFEDMTLPERLVEVQKRMAANDPTAEKLYTMLGEHLGHSAVWYRQFYDYDQLLILGRVTTGKGGDVILSTAQKVVAAFYPEEKGLEIAMPDEKAKRLGQSVAAAALCKHS